MFVYIINIIISFLKDRFFEIKIGNYVTDRHRATRGCPQGAFSSPTCYKVYSNDTPLKNVKNICYTLMFADDLVYFRLFKKYTKN